MVLNNKYKTMYSYDVREMIFRSTCRTTVSKLILYAISLFAAFIVLIFILQYFITNQLEELKDTTRERSPTDLKYILFWRPHEKENKEYQHPIGQELFVKQKCTFVNCYVTFNKSLLLKQNYDAVVFDVRDAMNLNLNNVNLTRSPQQKYIFRSLEPSEKYPLCNISLDNFFNWTWTYKLDSDIAHPYFNIYNHKNKLIGPRRNMNWSEKMKHNRKFKRKVANKNNAVAWITNKCKLNPKHKEFVEELKNELRGYKHTVDIFGPCAKKCPKGSINKCYKAIEMNYYFHLVLEDYHSVDFVTKSLAKTMNYALLPIVWGGADYKSYLPPGSYINVKEFDLKKLGAIINYLIKYPNIYEYFFDWKRYYYYTTRPKSFMCDLCTKLNHNNSNHKQKIYKKIRRWWLPEYKKYCSQKSQFQINKSC